MKLKEYIESIDREDVSIHIPNDFSLEKVTETGVLLISHDLSMSGAPLQLYELSSALIGIGYAPTVFSLRDGPLLNMFLDSGSIVICNEGSISDGEWLKRLIKGFGLVFINTLLLAPLVRFLAPVVPCLFWWIHESSSMFEYDNCVNIPNTPSLKILAASKICQTNIERYMKRSSAILNISIRDYGMAKNYNRSKTVFLWAGVMYWIKAPEVLFRAILSLPTEYLLVSEFFVIGSNNSGDAYIELVKELDGRLPNVHYIQEIPHEELMQIIDEIDAVVVTSIEETTSMVAVEGLMKGKAVLCSDGCGICGYLENGRNALIHPANNSDVLCENIKYIIDHHEETRSIACEGRFIYEKYYSRKVFEQNVESILKSIHEEL